jgi:hypothetical protein
MNCMCCALTAIYVLFGLQKSQGWWVGGGSRGLCSNAQNLGRGRTVGVRAIKQTGGVLVCGKKPRISLQSVVEPRCSCKPRPLAVTRIPRYWELQKP